MYYVADTLGAGVQGTEFSGCVHLLDASGRAAGKLYITVHQARAQTASTAAVSGTASELSESDDESFHEARGHHATSPSSEEVSAAQAALLDSVENGRWE